jgi:hypothetical protein
MYISRPSYSSKRASFIILQSSSSLFLFPFYFTNLLALPSRRSSGGTAVRTISTDLPHFRLISASTCRIFRVTEGIRGDKALLIVFCSSVAFQTVVPDLLGQCCSTLIFQHLATGGAVACTKCGANMRSMFYIVPYHMVLQ